MARVLTCVTGMNVLIFLVMFTALLLYFLTAEERVRLLRTCREFARRAAREAIRRLRGQPDDDGEPAQSMTLATWLVVLVNVWVFAGIVFGGGAAGDPGRLLAWGGSFGPRTTNGEWWRLVTATFVHSGLLHVVATLAGLIQIACITERLVGPLAFLSAYVAAGTLANVVCLSRSPVTVTAGGAGAVLGIYGLLVATATWGLLRGERVRVPWRVTKGLLPGIGLFLLYTLVSGGVDRVVVAVALGGGAITGLLLAKGARNHKPALRRIALLTADTAALIILFAVPLRGMADVRPEIARLMTVEDRTAKAYDAAVVRFKASAIQAGTLAQLIDEAVVPELVATRSEIDAIERVPRDHAALVARAREFLRLRIESWSLRSTALRTARLGQLKEADRKQWQALDVLEGIRTDLAAPRQR